VLRKIVAIRKLDADERAEQEALLELFLSALGMTPLEEAAARDDDVAEADPEDLVSAEEADRLYAKAVTLVRDDGRPSTSYIQRQLSLTYNLASRLLERMEREGVVSAANFAGKRDDGKVVAIRKGKPKPPHDAIGFDVGAGA
jgi:DNA segregation ATPase FtsK/SpoIIIE-like protein